MRGGKPRSCKKNSKSDSKNSNEILSSWSKLSEDPYKILSDDVSICKKEDHTKRKNCSKQPWCLFGLGESKNGELKDAQFVYNCLGNDLTSHFRQRSTDVDRFSCPTGMKNLGATCYLNVFVQCFFHNLLIRDSIFNMIPEMGESQHLMSKVVESLQKTFIRMDQSCDGLTDLTEFIDLLGLKKGEQQDPQEFFKLFIGQMDNLKLPLQDKTRSSFTTLLTGKLQYRLRCSGCSEEHNQPYTFHELDLSVEGQWTLENAIDSFFSSESLNKDNQYECSTCEGRRDATRDCQLLESPTVLSCHLLRYDYDKLIGEKRKLQTELTFPERLTLGGAKYKLVAVLYHLGRSAYGGHYVCDVLEWGTEQCWRLDDDAVSLTDSPFETVTTVDVESETTQTQKRRKTDKSQSSSVNGTGSSSAGLGEGKVKGRNEVNPKRDAYALFYVKEERVKESVASSRVNCLNEKMIDDVMEESRVFKGEVEKYEEKRLQVTKLLKDRQTAYSDAFSEENCNKALIEGFHLLPVDWLKKWVTGDPSTFPLNGLGLDLNTSKSTLVEKPIGVREETKLEEISNKEKIIEIDKISKEGIDISKNNENKSVKINITMNETDLVKQQEGLIAETSNGLIDMNYFLCPHGKGLDPGKANGLKVVSDSTFRSIFQSESTNVTGVTFDLHENNYRCEECCTVYLERRFNIFEAASKNDSLLNVLVVNEINPRQTDTQEKDGFNNEEEGYYVAKVWLTQLKKYINSLTRSLSGKTQKIDFSPKNGGTKNDPIVIDGVTESITSFYEQQSLASDTNCVNELKPDAQVNSVLLCDDHCRPSVRFERRAVCVNRVGWEELCKFYPQAVAIKLGCESCEECDLSQQQQSSHVKQLRENRSYVTQVSPALAALSKNKKIIPAMLNNSDFLGSDSGDPFYLVDGLWLRYWRQFLSDVKYPAPSPLMNKRLRCVHGKALICDPIRNICDGFNPKHLEPNVLSVRKFSEEDQAVFVSGRSKEAPLPDSELVSTEQWKALHSEFFLSSLTSDSTTGTDNDFPMEEDNPVEDESSEQTDTNKGEKKGENVFTIKFSWSKKNSCWCWEPGHCLECAEEVQKVQQYKAEHYSDVSLSIKVVKDASQLPSSGDQEQRQQPSSSSRKGRAARGKVVKVKVSSGDSLSLLKLKIFESFRDYDLIPSSQKIFNQNGDELQNNLKTLAQFGVKATDSLFVLDSLKTKENGGRVTDVWSDHMNAGSQEQGFGGTALTRGHSIAGEGMAAGGTGELVEIVEEGFLGGEDEAFERDLMIAMELSKRSSEIV